MPKLTPHKHAEVIHKYAEGYQIQYRTGVSYTWDDITWPSFDGNGEYRVKPENLTVKYRRFVTAGSYGGRPSVCCLQYISKDTYRPQDAKDFVGWIDLDWITSEVQP